MARFVGIQHLGPVYTLHCVATTGAWAFVVATLSVLGACSTSPVVASTATAAVAPPTPRALPPGAVTLHIHEMSAGQLTSHAWPADTPRLFEKLPSPLGSYDCDIVGEGDECYDVFISDERGTFDKNGRFLTFEASWLEKYPKPGGLNIAEVVAELADGTSVHASKLVRARAAGDNAEPNTARLALDEDLETWCTLGNSTDGEPLSLTVGF